MDDDLDLRASRFAALGDPIRLRIADELSRSDRAPSELRALVGIESNLLAHHLDVLSDAGLVVRNRSSGDGRRRYVHLVPDAIAALRVGPAPSAGDALFVCTANSARSQLAAALWTDLTGRPATSAGTHPAAVVHPGAVAAATRAGLDLGDAVPAPLAPDDAAAGLVVTVCDRAHEELAEDAWLHWSIPDPVSDGRDEAFDAVVSELRGRIRAIAGDPQRA